jgi:3-phenylpropionate/trans-cinnamate dioxygenase ferredoxin subunit
VAPDGIVEAVTMEIKARKNGPYLVSGDLSELRLIDSEGNPYDLTGKPNIALCRCGGSLTKPFCDGTHSRTGFEAAESAVRAEEDAGGAVPPEL